MMLMPQTIPSFDKLKHNLYRKVKIIFQSSKQTQFEKKKNIDTLHV